MLYHGDHQSLQNGLQGHLLQEKHSAMEIDLTRRQAVLC